MTVDDISPPGAWARELAARPNRRRYVRRRHAGDAVVYVSMDRGGCMTDKEAVMTGRCDYCGGWHTSATACPADQPKTAREYTVTEYGSLGAAIVAERDALRAEVAALRAENGMLDLENTRMRNLLTDMRADPSLSNWHERIDDAWSAIP